MLKALRKTPRPGSRILSEIEDLGIPFVSYSVEQLADECVQQNGYANLMKDSLISIKEPTSVLAPSMIDIHRGETITGEKGDALKHTPNLFPMEFKVALRNQNRILLFYQGGDPFELPHVRTSLVNFIEPDYVIRLNHLHGVFEQGESASDYYGEKCKKIFHVNDFLPAMIKDYNLENPDEDVNAHIAALAIIASRIHRDLLPLLIQNPQHNKVYLHCQMGLERSRTMFILLNALFYIHSVKLIDSYEDEDIVLDWTARQSLLPIRSLLELLTVKSPNMFTALTHMIAMSVGLDERRTHRRIMKYQPSRGERGGYLPVEFEARLITQCDAGSLCLESESIPKYYCAGCYCTFYCDKHCFVRSGHGDLRGGCHRAYGKVELMQVWVNAKGGKF